METFTQELEKVTQKMQVQLNSGSQLTHTFLPEERRVLQVKYQSEPFCKMKPEDFAIAAEALILKIGVITGWQIPDENLDVLIDSFQKKLLLQYPHVNRDEFEYAFLVGGSAVEDWGKQLNLSLIDQVMLPYLQKRTEISKLEDMHKTHELPQPKEKMSDTVMREWFKSLQERKLSVEFMPLMIYDWMEKTGVIALTKAEKHDYVKRAASYYGQKLFGLADVDPERRREYAEFLRQDKAKRLTGNIADHVRTLAKKMVVFDKAYSDEKKSN